MHEASSLCLNMLFPQGSVGAVGLQGSPGLPGNPGVKGKQGLRGQKGLAGQVGLKGIRGKDGIDVSTALWLEHHSSRFFVHISCH